MKRILVSLVWLAAAFGGPLSVAAEATDPAADENGYGAGTYGRVRYLEAGATIVRSDTADASRSGEASVNDPIFPGDTLRTGLDARAEVQLAGGTLVRVDRGSDVVFQSLPDPYSDVKDSTLIDVSAGVVQLAAIVKDSEEVRIDTPAATVYLLGDGDFRIEVSDDGTTRVLSRRGVAEVNGDGASVLVRGGQRSVIAPDAAPQDPLPFRAYASDGFDAWVASRSAAYEHRESDPSEADAYNEAPAEVRPYYRELSGYGHWAYLPTYGYAWCPSGYGPEWRPYYAGGWQYGPGGYFWVSSEPWGWAPYHYGRWTWATGFGWCWLPGSVFGGAWVSWSWGPSHVGWCALDYWNHPAYYYGGAASWTFVGYSHFGSRDSGRYAVPADRTSGLLQGSAIVTRAPRVSPRVLVTDAGARERVIHDLADSHGARATLVAPRDHRGDRSFAEIERQIVRPGLRTASGAVAARPAPRPAAPPTARRPAAPVERSPMARPGAGGVPSERERARVPDRRSFEPRPGSQPWSQARRPEGMVPVVPRLHEGSSASEHVRDLYRRVAEPRVTGERGRPAGPPASVPRPVRSVPPSASRGAAAPPPHAAPPPSRQPQASGTREDRGRGGKKK